MGQLGFARTTHAGAGGISGRGGGPRRAQARRSARQGGISGGEARRAPSGWDVPASRGGSRRDAGALREAIGEELGQGTTEYAILVGVLVLMAIVAVVAFRENLQVLWTAITDGINSL